MLRRLFETVVERCAAWGLVGGTAAAVDGSTIAADANRDRRGLPHEVSQLWSTQETVARPVRAYLDQLEAETATLRDEPREGPEHKAPAAISETDPQAAWSTKDGPGRFSYETNYLVDTDHGIIVDVEATPARLSQEIVAAKAMLARSAKRHGFQPSSLAADGSYGTGPFLAWLLSLGIAPHVPVLDRRHQTKGKFSASDRVLPAKPRTEQVPSVEIIATPRRRAGLPEKASASPLGLLEEADEVFRLTDQSLFGIPVFYHASQGGG